MWKPDVCIYHGGCDDGFGAAWAVWKRWGDDVAYVPGVYGKPLPEVAGKHVLFVDFSAKREQTDAMAQTAASIVIIDHHKTAEADLAPFIFKPGAKTDYSVCAEDIAGLLGNNAMSGWPPIIALFDMEQSGAVMAWKFSHATRLIPEFLRYIEDRDLWRFKYGVGDATKRFSASLRTYGQEFNLWDKLAEPQSTASLISDGAGILRAHNANIQKFIADAYWDYIGGYFVPVVNVPYHYASDTAHALLSIFPEAVFTACWFRRGDGMIQYSLRSEDGRMDVSAVAASYGGGGHRNAAGFQIKAGASL